MHHPRELSPPAKTVGFKNIGFFFQFENITKRDNNKKLRYIGSFCEERNDARIVIPWYAKESRIVFCFVFSFAKNGPNFLERVNFLGNKASDTGVQGTEKEDAQKRKSG